MAKCMAYLKEALVAVDVVITDEDLSSWELIDPSDEDEADSCSYDELTNEDLECKEVEPVDSPSSDPSIDLSQCVKGKQESNGENLDGDEEEMNAEFDEDEDDEDEYDLDDELVPKWVNDRFGRERMRKLGKRAYPKMNKSKRLPYYYIRPGCVRGKHGLGLKHNFV